MDIPNKNINYLSIKEGEVSLSFNKENNKTFLLIKSSTFMFNNEYDNNSNHSLLFQLIEKKYFNMLGLVFEKTNSISLKTEIIIDTNSSTIEAIIFDNKILVFGKYSWSDIDDSLFYIGLNNKLTPKNIIIKTNKI